MGQPRISRHLKILADNHILVSRRDGLWVYYSAARSNGSSEFVRTVIEQIQHEQHQHYSVDLERARQAIIDRRNNTKNFFNSIAGEWESLKKKILGEFDIAGAIVGRLPSVSTTVDLGCGTGDLLPELCARSQNVIGVDSSPAMLDIARKKLTDFSHSIDLRLGELEHLPLRDGEADAAVINMVLHHVSQPQLVLAEARRVLNPDSVCVITDFDAHNYEEVRSVYGDRWLGFHRGQIEAWSADAGFTLVECSLHQVNLGLSIHRIVLRS